MLKTCTLLIYSTIVWMGCLALLPICMVSHVPDRPWIIVQDHHLMTCWADTIARQRRITIHNHKLEKPEETKTKKNGQKTRLYYSFGLIACFRDCFSLFLIPLKWKPSETMPCQRGGGSEELVIITQNTLLLKSVIDYLI